MSNKPNCSACNAPLIWRTAEPTEKNKEPKPNPLDASPSENGNILILETGEYKVLSKDALAQARAQKWFLYTSHFATCPNAQRFRRKK